jgi:hypothetical protein
MAKTVVALEATLNAKGAEQSLIAIKQNIADGNKLLNEAVEKYGVYSDEVKKAENLVLRLKKQLGEATQLSTQFSATDKLTAFNSALKTVTGGFSALTGTLGLFGSESKEIEKQLLKVQSALALSQGVESIIEASKGFEKLKKTILEFSIVQKVVTAAQKLWNAAMAANPIGAIVVAITALIAGVVALTSYFISNAKAAKEQTKSVEDSTKALDKQSKTLERNNSEFQKAQDYKLGLAKANGASTKSIRELESKLIEEKIAFQLASRATAQNTYEKEKNKLASLTAADADKELIKKQLDNVKKAVEEYNTQNKNVQAAVDERTAINRKHNIEVAQENTEASKKAAEKRKQDNEQAKKDQEQANKEILEANKQLQQQRRIIAEQEALNNIKDEDERAKKKLEFDYLRQKQEIEQSKATTAEKNATTQALYIQYIDSLNKIDEDRNAKRVKEANDALFALEQGEEEWLRSQADKELQRAMDESLSFEERKAALQERQDDYNRITFTSEDERLAYLKASADAQKQLDQDVADQKKAIQDAEFGALDAGVGFLSAIAGKSKALQKAAIIAEGAIGIAKMVTANQAANIGALATPQAIATSGAAAAPVIAFNNIKTALSIATTIAATAKALSALGGGGGLSGGATGAGGGTTAPVQPQVATTTINQGQVNQLASATSRAFVLESDVSGNQERIERLNRAARIN